MDPLLYSQLADQAKEVFYQRNHKFEQVGNLTRRKTFYAKTSIIFSTRRYIKRLLHCWQWECQSFPSEVLTFFSSPFPFSTNSFSILLFNKLGLEEFNCSLVRAHLCKFLSFIHLTISLLRKMSSMVCCRQATLLVNLRNWFKQKKIIHISPWLLLVFT